MPPTGPGMTPEQLAAIKQRWGLDGTDGRPNAYVDFVQAQRDIGELVQEIEHEWDIPWKMRDAKPPRA